jgi:hypothetical protein
MVNRQNEAERVTPDDFSDAKALGIWLVVSLLGGPLVYALAKRTGEFLFGQNKNEN